MTSVDALLGGGDALTWCKAQSGWKMFQIGILVSALGVLKGDGEELGFEGFDVRLIREVEVCSRLLVKLARTETVSIGLDRLLDMTGKRTL